jgi:hypothetical protein
METLKKDGLLFTFLTLDQNNMVMIAATEVLKKQDIYGIPLKTFNLIVFDWFCKTSNSSTKVQSIRGSKERYGYDIFFVSDTLERHEIGDQINDYLHQNSPQFFENNKNISIC